MSWSPKRIVKNSVIRLNQAAKPSLNLLLDMLYLHAVFGENKAPTQQTLGPYSLQIPHEDTACQGCYMII